MQKILKNKVGSSEAAAVSGFVFWLFVVNLWEKNLDYISVLGLSPNRLIIFPLFVTLDLPLYYMLLNKMC